MESTSRGNAGGGLWGLYRKAKTAFPAMISLKSTLVTLSQKAVYVAGAF